MNRNTYFGAVVVISPSFMTGVAMPARGVSSVFALAAANPTGTAASSSISARSRGIKRLRFIVNLLSNYLFYMYEGIVSVHC